MKQLHKITSCIVTMCFGRLNLIPDATLDSLSYYTAETFYQSLEIHSPPAAAIFVLY